MARLKTLSLGALNIKIHPSSPNRYFALIKAMYAMHERAQIHGSNWGLIGTLSDFNEDLLVGSFYRFLNIDPKEPWIDLIKRRPIATEQGEAIPVVPDHLKPNLKESFFLFYPHRHRLIFDLANISHTGVVRIIKALGSQHIIRQEFGEVEVIVESSEVGIEKILRIPTITRLEILLTRPNPDDIDGEAEEMQRRILEMRLNRYEQVLISNRNVGIKPDNQVKGAMRLALSNGRIDAVGYEGERRVSESTAKHPDIASATYDPGKETYRNAIVRMGDFFLGHLLNKHQDKSDSETSH